MTKLLCPLAGCHQTTFGVPTTHQVHIEQHLLTAHGIKVTTANRAYWRRRQDSVWEERFDDVEEKLMQSGSLHRARLAEMMEDGKAPVEGTEVGGMEQLERLQVEYAALVDVDDDSEDGSEDADDDAAGGGGVMRDTDHRDGDAHEDDRRDDAEGTGPCEPEYSASLRHYQLAEGKARAWIDRQEKAATLKSRRREKEREQGESERARSEAARELAALRRERRRMGLRVDDLASQMAQGKD